MLIHVLVIDESGPCSSMKDGPTISRPYVAYGKAPGSNWAVPGVRNACDYPMVKMRTDATSSLRQQQTNLGIGHPFRPHRRWPKPHMVDVD